MLLTWLDMLTGLTDVHAWLLLSLYCRIGHFLEVLQALNKRQTSSVRDDDDESNDSVNDNKENGIISNDVTPVNIRCARESNRLC